VKIVGLLVAALAMLAQARSPSPRALLDLARPLTATETATVVDAWQDALTGKTFRLSPLPFGQGPAVLMSGRGQPRIIQTISGITGGIVSGVAGASDPIIETQFHQETVTITAFTGRPVRRCDGSIEPIEMVVDYVRRDSTPPWTATAHRRSERDEGGPAIEPVFKMLRGDTPVASGERQRIGGRWARAFVSPWIAPSDRDSQRQQLTGDPLPNVVGEPAPNERVQSLWIDTESLLPLRWEVSKRGMLMLGFDFVYEPIDLRLPAGVDTPNCIR
jgi:hypothetical protein